ncbi:uncharacterized protein LOC135137316 [Zophobas morio]|uniref:uncharacterized protein LOC135137316 n=1 Tax=Zophobas morio TaxID=2755281 RepID=UPI003082CF1C
MERDSNGMSHAFSSVQPAPSIYKTLSRQKCDIVSIIHNMKTEIEVLKDELAELKKSGSNVADRDSEKKLSDEEIIAEIEDRNYRANNLILYNMSESQAESFAVRKEDDMSRCQNIVVPNGNNDNIKIRSCVRLGKYNQDKVRPLKIIFSFAQDAIDSLVVYRRLNINIVKSKDDVLSSEYFSSMFNVFRANKKGRGRGVLLAVKSHLSSKQLKLTSPVTDADLIGVKVHICYEEIFEYLEHESLISEKTLIVCDFNIPQYYNQMMQKENQQNLVTNAKGRLLDLILCSKDLKCTVMQSNTPVVDEDAHHPALSIILQVPAANLKELSFNFSRIKTKYNFRKGNYIELYRYLNNTDWSQLLVIKDVNVACDYFYSIIYDLLDRFIPKTPINTTTYYPVWYTPSIIGYIKRKRQLWKRYKKNKFDRVLSQINDLRRLIKKEIKVAYINFMVSAETNIKQDPKNVWAYINQKKNVSSIPGHVFNKGIELTDPQEIVNHFAIHFSDVFSSDNICDSFPVCDRESDIVSVLHNFVINTCDILDAVKKVSSNFTMGPDNVPAFLVKDCISCLCEPLCYLFNLIIAEAAYPNKWKSTKVIPVFKSGVRNNIENYRPIAIVSNFSKIFERIVANNLYSHVSNQLSPSQHGFIKGKSTSTNLCEYIQYISDSLESKKQVDVIYTDLSKAFDVVNHSILLDKLSKFGLCNIVEHLQ